MVGDRRRFIISGGSVGRSGGGCSGRDGGLGVLAAQLPANAMEGPALSADDDVDPSDNVSEYTVVVSLEDTGTGGGGGSLPVTGAPAALAGGVGAGALALGVMLYLAGRRRRVVLHTPDS